MIVNIYVLGHDFALIPIKDVIAIYVTSLIHPTECTNAEMSNIIVYKYFYIMYQIVYFYVMTYMLYFNIDFKEHNTTLDANRQHISLFISYADVKGSMKIANIWILRWLIIV